MKSIKNPQSPIPDKIFALGVRSSAIFVLILLTGIIASLIIASMPSIKEFGLRFLYEKEWDAPMDQFTERSLPL